METASTYSESLHRETSAAGIYSFRLYETIENVPVSLWDKIIPEPNVLMHHEYLRSLELSEKGKMQFRYVLVYRDNILAGAVYFQIVPFKGNDLVHFIPSEEGNWAKKFLNRTLELIIPPLVKMIDVKLLVSGNIFMSGESGFYFHPDIDKVTHASLLRKAVDEVVRKDSHISAVLISDLQPPHSEFDCDFGGCSFHEIQAEADMSLKIREEWKTFDDYLASLSSKYRVRARKAYKMNDKEGIVRRELPLEEIEKHEDRLYALYQEVMKNSNFKLVTLSKDFFALQKRQFPDNYHVYAYFHNDELISFITSYTFHKKMEIHYCGMESETSRPVHLYQRMMYDMLDLGIRLQMRQLHFGRTAPEIKSTIGARPSPTYGYVRHLNPFFNLFITPLLTRLLQPKEYIYRNPFKEEGS